MAIREYECPLHGYFQVVRPISAPITEICGICGSTSISAPRYAPVFGISGADGGIPNNSKDEAGYEQWQRETWNKFEDKLNVDNAGTNPIPTRKLLKRTDTPGS